MTEERLPQLVRDALRSPGRTFAVILDSRPQVVEALYAAAAVADEVDMIKRVKHTNGSQEIALVNGARIIFRTYRQSLRGRTLEAVLVHPDVRWKLSRSTAGLTIRAILNGGTAWDGWLRETVPTCAAAGGHVVVDW